jgi:hypothetical protein
VGTNWQGCRHDINSYYNKLFTLIPLAIIIIDYLTFISVLKCKCNNGYLTDNFLAGKLHKNQCRGLIDTNKMVVPCRLKLDCIPNCLFLMDKRMSGYYQQGDGCNSCSPFQIGKGKIKRGLNENVAILSVTTHTVPTHNWVGSHQITYINL